MASNEERMMILRMVEEGKISVEEGARLLTAMGEAQAEPVGAAASAADRGPNSPAFGGSFLGASSAGDAAGDTNGRVFHVRVTNGMTGSKKVDVNIPLGLVDFGLRFIPQNSKVDVNAIRDAIHKGLSGRIVDVMDNEKGDRVEIFIE